MRVVRSATLMMGFLLASAALASDLPRVEVCKSATCGCAEEPAGCDGTIQLFTDTACTLANSPPIELPNFCPSSNATIQSFQYVLHQPNFACGASGAATVDGEVVVGDDQVWTLCCLPE